MCCKLIVALLLTVLVTVCAGVDWCNNKSCQEKGKHTLCAYPKSGAAPACLKKGDLGGDISDSDKETILSVHNQFRQKVASGNETRGNRGPQPKAKPGTMPNLEWDDTLAEIAQRWADQCNFNHDKCRNVPDYVVGQNIGDASTTRPVTTILVADIVKMWYDEVQKFDKNDVSKFTGDPKTSHYTQIVWAQTKKIGCGLRNYSKNGFNHRYLVCNYGPSGNYIGEALYQT